MARVKKNVTIKHHNLFPNNSLKGLDKETIRERDILMTNVIKLRRLKSQLKLADFDSAELYYKKQRKIDIAIGMLRDEIKTLIKMATSDVIVGDLF